MLYMYIFTKRKHFHINFFLTFPEMFTEMSPRNITTNTFSSYILSFESVSSNWVRLLEKVVEFKNINIIYLHK